MSGQLDDLLGTGATLVAAARWYLIAGLAVAAAFLGFGVDRVEPGARGAYVFRPLLIPAVALLWPLVLWRWAALERGVDPAARHRPPRAAHRIIWTAMAALIPALLIAALLTRQNGPYERPAVLLSAPEAVR